MNQTDLQGETERALRADILGAVTRGWCSPNNAAKVMDADLAEAITAELLPLFNAGIAGAYAAAAKAVDASRDKIGRIMHESWTRTKREQGFHHHKESDHASIPPCSKCHPDLIDWDELPQKQKDINLHAFDDVLPVLIEAIRALTPADARQAQQEADGCDCDAACMLSKGHSGECLFSAAAIASAEARARLSGRIFEAGIAAEVTHSHKQFSDYFVRHQGDLQQEMAELEAAARTPDSTGEQS